MHILIFLICSEGLIIAMLKNCKIHKASFSKDLLLSTIFTWNFYKELSYYLIFSYSPFKIINNFTPLIGFFFFLSTAKIIHCSFLKKLNFEYSIFLNLWVTPNRKHYFFLEFEIKTTLPLNPCNLHGSKKS